MRDRTADLLRARQALSQLSYSPKFLWLFPLSALSYTRSLGHVLFVHSLAYSYKLIQLKNKSCEIYFYLTKNKLFFILFFFIDNLCGHSKKRFKLL